MKLSCYRQSANTAIMRVHSGTVSVYDWAHVI
jgi:hypothetical protein